MKKTDLIVLAGLILLVVVCMNTKAVGEAPPDTSTPSSSGCPQIHTDCAGEPSGCGAEFGIYDPTTCTCICPDSSNSNESTTLSSDFTGIWKSKPASTTTSSSGDVSPSRLAAHIESEATLRNPVILKLCVKDGELEGTIHQAMVFNNGMIVSQDVVSASEVNITAESKDGDTLDANIKLTSEREFLFTYDDGDSFTARKNNTFKACGTRSNKPPTRPSHSMSGMSGMSSNDKEGARPPIGMFGGGTSGLSSGFIGGVSSGISSGGSTSGVLGANDSSGSAAPGLITETGIPARN